MKTNTAVLHLKTKEPQKVYNLSGRVSTNLMTNVAIFATPEPDMRAFNAEIIKLDTALKEKDGSKVKYLAITNQTDVVYGMLKSLLLYVNKIANGDMGIILLSGFDCNNEPMEHDVPGKARIKRLEDGSVPCSIKIYLDALDDADRYKVEISTTPDDEASWKTVIDFAALNRLEIKGLVAGQKIYVRVTGGNTHGLGVASDPIPFIPR